MKIKLEEIIKASSALVELQRYSLPVKISYRLKRLLDRLTPILKSYDEKRVELVKEFGEQNEKKEFEVRDPEKLKLFHEKHNELLEFEEEVEFDKIKIKELGNINIPAKDLVDFVFEE